MVLFRRWFWFGMVQPAWSPGTWQRPLHPANRSRAARRVVVALRCRLVVTFPRPVHLVGALARLAAAGTSTVPGGAELVGHLRP